jgi:transposase
VPGLRRHPFSKLGEDVTDVLDKIPARLKVIRHIRPKLSCRACETIIQAPAPNLPIEKGRPGAGLIANVVTSKYLDGLPLYRQSAILAREGIEIERATLADWVGHAAWWVSPLAAMIGAYVMAAEIIHTSALASFMTSKPTSPALMQSYAKRRAKTLPCRSSMN